MEGKNEILIYLSFRSACTRFSFTIQRRIQASPQKSPNKFGFSFGLH